jgi:hypothetical protein
MMEYWNNGRKNLEQWNNGMMGKKLLSGIIPNIPKFHDSNISFLIHSICIPNQILYSTKKG